VFKYENIQFIYDKVLAILAKFKQNSNTFVYDLEGQRHGRVRVRFSLVKLKALSKGLLCPNITAIQINR
jgi:hypothetical protein